MAERDREREGAWFAEAMALAASHHPHPNPRVGSLVIAADGEVVGRGAHAAAGTDHAETIALAEAGPRARGGTVVVTLEPCSHHGRTPPCVQAILEAGVSRVLVGAADPDERVNGRGIASLRAAGVAVEVARHGGVESVDPGYFHHRRTGRPRVTLKSAATLDGQTAAADGTSWWITSPDARRDAHHLRARSDAVMVGAGTLLADNPKLTVRLEEFDGPQPRPVIVAGSRPLPTHLALFGRDPLVYAPERIDVPGEIVVMPGTNGVDLASIIADLGKRQIVDLLVEGGASLATALLNEGLVDRVVVYLAAALAGGTGIPMFTGVFPTMDDLARLVIGDVTRVGSDVRIEAVFGEGS